MQKYVMYKVRMSKVCTQVFFYATVRVPKVRIQSTYLCTGEAVNKVNMPDVHTYS